MKFIDDMHDSDSIQRKFDYGLRHKLYAQFMKWNITPEGDHGKMAEQWLVRYLGYTSTQQMWVEFSNEDRDKIWKLLGPHGYVIYKAIEAKHG